jgi:hypothetical protein
VVKHFPVDDKVDLEMYCATVTEYFPEEENEDNADLWLIVYGDEEMEGFTKDELDEASAPLKVRDSHSPLRECTTVE